ncbi:hypothetical protein EJB05_54814, partial [Eragrostis curvula]
MPDGSPGAGSPSPETDEITANPATVPAPLVQQRIQGISAKPKRKTLFSFYKRVTAEGEGADGVVDQNCELDATPKAAPNVLQDEAQPVDAGPAPKTPRLNSDGSVLIVECDPGLRCQIWDYPVDEQDRARRIYVMLGPYQFVKDKYPYSGSKSHPRCFQAHWFKEFSCYNVTCYNNLKNQLGHIDNMVEQRTTLEVKRNRLQLKVTIDTIRWLAFQACAFRGHDESENSKNQGNFLEMVKLLAKYDDEVKAVVLGSAPGNAKYTSPTIQKEILDIMASKVQKLIRDEIGDAKFCLIVDESRDESRKEQMALVVHFVDKDGFIRERFLDIVHVHDTSSATLKEELSSLLSHHGLDVQNIRGQGYDGASNMCGEWNGLQAKFMAECPYAYYVHCFAHQLQLALVAASKEVPEVQ